MSLKLRQSCADKFRQWKNKSGWYLRVLIKKSDRKSHESMGTLINKNILSKYCHALDLETVANQPCSGLANE